MEVLKDTTFDTDHFITKASQRDLDNVLITARTLKEIRQLLIQGGSYEYPSVADIKMSTQKINSLHELNQGKVLIIQELVKDTLIELRGNMLKFKKACQDPRQMLVFGRLLCTLKRVGTFNWVI
jgi:hypothetical protein